MADRATLTPAPPVTGVVLARQPIFDANLKLQAFELLYRAVGEDGRPVDGGRATATVLVAALADVGLQRLVGERRAFLNVDREFLLAFRPLPLPADRVVLELVEDQQVDEDLIAVLAEL
jgi:EAL and modified HD-GYP domain-containing signal transduction protein